jgi:hypothetical protein
MFGAFAACRAVDPAQTQVVIPNAQAVVKVVGTEFEYL